MLRRGLLMVHIAPPVPPVVHELEVDGASSIIAETFNMVAVYDGEVDVTSAATWSIISGNTYATIDNTGLVTILSGASGETITIQAQYAGLTASQNVIVTYKSGSSSHTETEVVVDPSGNTTTTVTTVTENEDGSSSTSSESITYDENGNTIGSQTTDTTVNADGSSSSSSTSFNENGDPVAGSNNTIDVEGNSNTQKVVYDDSGNTRVVEYTIDTSANTGGTGEDITGDGINTHFIPFKAPEGFVMHMRFKSIYSEQPNPPVVPDPDDSGTNYLYNIMSAKATQKIGNIWPGFDVRWEGDGKLYVRRTLSGETSSAKVNITDKHINNVYEITVTYNPNETTNKFTVYDNVNNVYLWQINKKLQENLDLDLTLGCAISSLGTQSRYADVTFYDFSVVEL